MILLPAASRAAKPWKNGAGITREVAAFPPRCGLESFDWRISIADVTDDGPFSIFPGVDRTIIILSGDGIALEVAGRSSRLRPCEAPYSFPADQPTGCALLGGPVTDLNVMSRRGEIAHAVTGISEPKTITVGEGVLVWIKGAGRVTGPQGSFEMNPMDAIKSLTREEWKIEGKNFLAYYAAFTRLK